MCDYRIESKKALVALPVPMGKVRGYLGPIAHNKLLQVVKSGRARPGHDLYDGKLLPNGSLARGHYMSAGNFKRALMRMASAPHRCEWCGGLLPVSLVRQHQQPHDPSEQIEHHYHPNCWRARLLAVAAIFGHVRPEQLIAHGALQRPRGKMRETIIVTVKKIFTVNRRPQIGEWRKWQQ